jgi:hypothetical protein
VSAATTSPTFRAVYALVWGLCLCDVIGVMPINPECMLQVVDGMCVKNLKEKIWNLTGIAPRNQCLVMSNGAAAEDSMQFAGSGMQQFEVLYLKTV